MASALTGKVGCKSLRKKIEGRSESFFVSGELSTQQCSKEDLIYDRSVMKSTLIEDYGLVCEKAGLRSKIK